MNKLKFDIGDYFYYEALSGYKASGKVINILIFTPDKFQPEDNEGSMFLYKAYTKEPGRIRNHSFTRCNLGIFDGHGVKLEEIKFDFRKPWFQCGSLIYKNAVKCKTFEELVVEAL